ncbi:hypothetical protein [Faecalicatena contorta]
MGETFLMMLLELIIAAFVVIGAIGIKRKKNEITERNRVEEHISI